jgi:DNA-binding transcriptional regulator YdaS (Cro superfamily)
LRIEATLTIVAVVVDLTPHLDERRRLASSELVRAARSDQMYRQVVAKACAARRRDFESAIKGGVSIEELAEAVGLDAEDVEEIVGT